MKEKLNALLVEYGKVALVVYLVIFAITLTALIIGAATGFDVEGTAEGVGLVAGVWAMLKITQPGRIALTAVLTPFVARLWRRRTGAAPQAPVTTDDAALVADASPALEAAVAEPE